MEPKSFLSTRQNRFVCDEIRAEIQIFSERRKNFQIEKVFSPESNGFLRRIFSFVVTRKFQRSGDKTSSKIFQNNFCLERNHKSFIYGAEIIGQKNVAVSILLANKDVSEHSIKSFCLRRNPHASSCFLRATQKFPN